MSSEQEGALPVCDFFVAGGTLAVQAPSYVPRPADEELFQRVMRGEFCYVLTARQVGKSSLMVRTAEQLRSHEVRSAIIDLTGIGTGAAEEWYLGLVTRIWQGLCPRPAADGRAPGIAEWWVEHSVLSPQQRFRDFLHDVVLAEVPGRAVIFIDEIDSTLNLKFRDDFFSAIRAIYNARASEPVYGRLTFVLLGVATPTDLIRDRDRTPFNIGHRIILGDFSYADAAPLRNGLDGCHPGSGDRLLERILYWTNGHPYLTQRLCLAVAERSPQTWDDGQVDALVVETFLSEDGRRDANLSFIQDRVRASSSAEQRRMLKLYERVYSGATVPDDDRSQTQNRLELYGLVSVEDGRLRVRNRVYREVFDWRWIKAVTPSDSGTRVAVAAVVTAMVILISALVIILTRPKPLEVQARTYEDLFTSASTDAGRLDALSRLYGLGPAYYERGARLFYELNPDQQSQLFLYSQPPAPEPLFTVIAGVASTLDEQLPDRPRLLSAMIAALKRPDGGDAAGRLSAALAAWQKGRDLYESRQYSGALGAYAEALNLNPDNPVLHFERAEAGIAAGSPAAALADLEAVVRIANTAPRTPTPAPTPSTPAVALALTPTGTKGQASPLATPRGTRTELQGTGGGSTSAQVPTPGLELALSPTPAPRFRSRFLNPESMLDAVARLFAATPALANALANDAKTYPQLLSSARRLDITLVSGSSSIAATITGLSYDAERGQYAVSILLSDPVNVSRLILTIAEEQNGRRFDMTLSPPSQGSAWRAVIDAAKLTPGKYMLTVQAVDRNGLYISRPDSGGGLDPQLAVILASKEFLHVGAPVSASAAGQGSAVPGATPMPATGPVASTTAQAQTGLGVQYLKDGRYAEALDAFQQALALQRSVPDRTAEGKTLQNIGLVYIGMGRFSDAVQVFVQSLTASREVKDLEGEAATLRYMGQAYRSGGQLDQALDALQQASTTFELVGDRAGEAAVLADIGQVYLDRSQFDKALVTLQQSLVLYREVGDRAGEAGAWGGIGQAYRGQSQFDSALAAYQQDLEIERSISNRVGEGWMLLSIGVVYLDMGRYSDALDRLQESLAIYSVLDDLSSEGTVLQYIGRAYRNLNQPDKALEAFRQALVLVRQLGDRASEAAVLYGMGQIYLTRSDYVSALDSLQQSVAIYRAQNDAGGQALGLESIGGAYLVQGDVARAISSYDEATLLQPSSASAYSGRGSARLRAGDVAGAIADYSKSIELAPGSPSTYYARGLARETAGDTIGAIQDFQQALKLSPDSALTDQILQELNKLGGK